MNDYVDQVIQDYLSYLEDGAPEPSLDHLTPEDRALAEDLIKSLNAGRGIDPYQSRPSLDALLRGTEHHQRPLVSRPRHCDGCGQLAVVTDVWIDRCPMTLCQPCVLDALTAEGERLGNYWEIES